MCLAPGHQEEADPQVLLGRDHTKWNFDLVIDLIEGPLHTPKRMDEAIRATKFVRRLMGFLQPHNNRFASIKRTRVSLDMQGADF